MLRTLDAPTLAQVHALQAELGDGASITPERWADLLPTQARLATALAVLHGPANATEPFVLLRDAPNPAPLLGPRWWFHLLGLRHGAVHIVLTTPQGWFVAQRRSRAKDDAPGALDVAVTGHIGTDDPLAAAWRELGEELGLGPVASGEAATLVDDELHLFATQEIDIRHRAEENPPFIDRERHWLFAAALTAAGMARMRFTDGEVTSLVLLGPTDVAEFAARCRAGESCRLGEWDIAPGLLHTLPLWQAIHEGTYHE